MSTAFAILNVLADGEAHSGEALARRFGVTRAAIWKQIAKLEPYGVSVEATPGRGYRLSQPIDFLDHGRIVAALTERSPAVALEVFPELDSTNRYLLACAPPGPGVLRAALAEFQHTGRGRQGRPWTAPLGGGICLSVSWTFNAAPRDLSALGLAIGVVVRRAIASLAPVEIGLKWPNDLVHDQRKLGGVLVELSAEAYGSCHVVAGLGINVSIPAGTLVGLSDWPRGGVDLATALASEPPDRSRLAAALIDALADLFEDYARTGFGPYAEEWQRAHVLADRPVRLVEPAGESVGIARGIALDGALLLETDDGHRRRVIAGDVSLREAR